MTPSEEAREELVSKLFSQRKWNDLDISIPIDLLSNDIYSALGNNYSSFAEACANRDLTEIGS